MEFLTCVDGVISTGAGGEALCSGTWVGVADGITLTLAELSLSDLALLLAAGLVTFIFAYTFKVVRKQMGF